MSVPEKFKNVLNPNQTKSEIRQQVKFLERMLAKLKLNQTEENELLLVGKEWRW